MKISFNEYKNKVYGCWLGKNIGGTLGAPFEGKRDVFDINFYTQQFNGNPPPNDDLDLQLVWLNAVERFGRAIDAYTLGEYWLYFITPLWGEYGSAKANLQQGIVPPMSGYCNNTYGQSNGCWIRSEIWACIAPGYPQTAVKYAYEDAIVDHYGEGVFAEVFCAALESAAFVEKDLFKLIDIALSYIPENCDVAKGVKIVLDDYRSGKDWKQARIDVLNGVPGTFGIQVYTLSQLENHPYPIDKVANDAPSNVALMILGMVYGEGDFDKSLCTAVNCGEDADCTCGTLGALFGIIYGADSIPEKWKAPLQDNINTCCINYTVGGLDIPNTVSALTERILRLTPVFLGRGACDILANDTPYVLNVNDPSGLSCPPHKQYIHGIGFGNYQDDGIFRLVNTSPMTVRRDFLTLHANLEYLDGNEIRSGEPKHLRLSLWNNVQLHDGWNQWVTVKWFTDEGVTVLPNKECKTLVKVTYHKWQVLDFEIVVDNPCHTVNLIVDISVNGHHSGGQIKATYLPTVDSSTDYPY